MILVDLILRAKEKKEGTLIELMRNFDIQSNGARLKREQDLKVKDMKELAYGKYSVQVPSFNLCKFVVHFSSEPANNFMFTHFSPAIVSILSTCAARHYDRPLSQSSSRVCREKPKEIRRAHNRRVSVADIGRKNPLIPGQQLYGCMIPRPEYDEKIHQYERAIAEQKMQSFKDCVGRINGLDGLSEFERRQLIRLDASAGTPLSIGYEVVPLEISESVATDTDSSEDTKREPLVTNLLRSVSVKLMSDKLGYVDQREAKNLILESDGITTYCISEHSENGEEGIEISHTDFPDTIREDENEYEHVESLMLANPRVSHTPDNGLSFVVERHEDMQGCCSPQLEDIQGICPSPLEASLLKHKIE